MNDAVKGWLMLAPTLFFMFIFTVWPILKSAYLGLTAFEIGMPKPQFIGLHNYIEFAKSELFWKVMRNTLYFSVLTVVPAFIIGLMLAMLEYEIYRLFPYVVFLSRCYADDSDCEYLAFYLYARNGNVRSTAYRNRFEIARRSLR